MVRIQVLNSIVAFHYLKIAAQETPSKNRKRSRLLFDEIESDVLSGESDDVLVGAPREQVFYFNTSASAKKEQDSDEDEAELASATATRSEIVRDVLCKGSNCFEGERAMMCTRILQRFVFFGIQDFRLSLCGWLVCHLGSLSTFPDCCVFTVRTVNTRIVASSFCVLVRYRRFLCFSRHCWSKPCLFE